jgi:RNA polymerase sigma-70 factor (ECF subfamily)
MDRERDDALVAAARDGDQQAFEELVREHIQPVYAHALRMFREPSSAEDAVQEVFVKVLRGLATFDGQSAFSTWLYRVTRNVCLDMLRAGSRRPVPVDPLDMLDRSQPDFADAVATSSAIEQAIKALAPEDRDALNAVTLFGLSYAEAAESLGVPAGTVKSRVFRARRTIAAELFPGSISDGGGV